MGSTIESQRGRNIRRLSSVAVLAVALGGCTTIVEFPECSIDPQTKTQTLRLSDGLFDYSKSVDGVTFWLTTGTNPKRVDIKAARDRVKLVEENHVQFKGVLDGRTYDVKINQPVNVGSYYQADVTVSASCEVAGK